MFEFLNSDYEGRKPKLAWVFFFLVLLIASIQGYKNLDRLYSSDGVSLSSPIEDWIRVWYPHDMSAYIKVANNISKGLGIIEFCEAPRCQPAQWVPWHFWGPGTPLFFSVPISIASAFSWNPMQVIFFMGILCQILIAFFAVKTVRLYSHKTGPVLLALFFCAYFPPFQDLFFFGDYIGTSEVAICVFLAAFLYYFQKGFQLLWTNPKQKKMLFILFMISGFLLGIMHIARESMITFAPFVLVMTVLLAFIKKVSRPHLLTAFICGVLFYLSAASLNIAVKKWNEKRVGIYAVGSGTLGIFHDNLWAKWDGKDDTEIDQPWYVEAGIGFPSFLSPEEGQRIRQQYESPERYSDGKALIDFIKVVLLNPVDAVVFKLKRLPILLFDMNKIPKSEIKTATNFWMVLLYALAGIYVFICWRKRLHVPEMIYFYFLFICCSFVMIHAEFRYTFPVVFALRLIPSLLFSNWLEHVKRKNHVSA